MKIRLIIEAGEYGTQIAVCDDALFVTSILSQLAEIEDETAPPEPTAEEILAEKLADALDQVNTYRLLAQERQAKLDAANAEVV